MIETPGSAALELGDETHVWLLATGGLPESDLDRWTGSLSVAEAERLETMKIESARRQFVAGRGLVRETLSRYAAVDPAAWSFSAGPKGRLEVSDPLLPVNLRFNLSHTPGFVACAVAAGRPVGVDVQRIDDNHPLRRMAVRRFHAEEAALFADLEDDADLPHRFYTHWTLKEALVKAMGADLATSLRRFAIRIDGGRASFVDAAERESAARWRLALFGLGDDHLLAVADARPAAGPIRSFARLPGPLATPSGASEPAVAAAQPLELDRLLGDALPGDAD